MSLVKRKEISEEEAAEVILRRRGARNNFVKFCEYLFPDEPPARHHVILCDALDRVASGDLNRLMVFMPPGSAKSSYASVRFPAYYLGKFPDKSIICGSYGEGLSTTFGRKVRNIVDSPEYHLLFDTRLSEDSRAKGEWETKAGGSYYAVGVGSGVTGRRSDLNLVDDPVKGRKDADSELVRNEGWNWYLADFCSRLKMNTNTATVIIQTRWHEDDLSGRILPDDWNFESGTFEGFDGQPWEVICLPAEAEENDILGRKKGEWLWPEAVSIEKWKEIKATQTAKDVRNWSALWQQRPQPDSGVYFQREWFQRYKPGKHPDISMYAASDYAVTDGGGDFTEHGIGGFDKDKHLWFKDWWSGQTTSDVWINEQVKLAKKYQPYTWVSEVGVIRRSVEPFLIKRQRDKDGEIFRMEWLPHIGNKGAHCRAFQAMASQGMVHIPNCDWGDKLLDELVRFIPNTNFKDDKADVCGHFGRIIHSAFAPTEMSIEPEKQRDSYGLDDEPVTSWKVG